MSRLLSLFAVCCAMCSVSAGQRAEMTNVLPSAGGLGPAFNAIDVARRVARARDGSVVDHGEFLLDTSTTTGPTPSSQSHPASAFDGTNFLVVWRDLRGGYYGIYGCRVTPAGLLLDPQGIVISDAASEGGCPVVCFDGTEFLVAWEDRRGGGDYDISGCRVTPDGAVLDSLGIAISTGLNDQRAPAVSYDGTDFLVVWQDARSGNSDIYCARVDSDGGVLDPQGIAISAGSDYQQCPAVAFDGTNFLVVWEDDRGGYHDIFGCRVTPAGAVLEPLGFAISTGSFHQRLPAVSHCGEDFLVVWEDERSGYGIYGSRVTPAGAVLDPQGIAISVGANGQQLPAVSYDGTNSLVVWSDVRGGDWSIYGSRVTPAGAVLDPQGIAISTGIDEQRSPAISSDGTNFFVLWSDSRGDDWDIYGCRLTPGGTVLEPQGIVISTGVNEQCLPAISSDGTNFLVVWSDSRGDGTDVYGCRVTPSGTVLDPQDIVIATAAGDQRSPAVSFDGTNFLVVWDNCYDIYGCRVTSAGAVLDPQGIAISTAANAQEYPTVSFSGTDYLVVWEDLRGGSSDIYGCRVTPTGAVLDPQGIAISTGQSTRLFPAAEFDGLNFLVAWEDSRGGCYDIYGCRVAPEGAVLDPQGIAISTGVNPQWSPAVSNDGMNSLVVWSDLHYGDDIYGCRVRSDGTVFDEGPVVRQEGNQWYPALACGPGSQIFMVYQGWAGNANRKTYNAFRIWGKINPNPGVDEAENREAKRDGSRASIVRGLLVLSLASGLRRGASGVLLDISGRRVMELQAGANDVSRLSPGVYFVRSEPSAASRRPSAVQKVVITG